MKRALLLFLLIILSYSCKSKKGMVDMPPASVSEEADKSVTESSKTFEAAYLKIVDGHYAINKDFKTLQINGELEANVLPMSLNADIRIERGRQILITLKKLGITGARLLITPDRVSYYETVNNTYYDGDFEFLSTFLGTKLDYEKVENLLIGNALFNLKEKQLSYKVENKLYKLEDDKPNFEMIYLLNGLMQLKQMNISQKNSTNKLVIDYSGYQKVDGIELPKDILIKAIQKGDNNFKVSYNRITVNPALSFPYRIPENYKSIQFN